MLERGVGKGRGRSEKQKISCGRTNPMERLVVEHAGRASKEREVEPVHTTHAFGWQAWP